MGLEKIIGCLGTVALSTALLVGCRKDENIQSTHRDGTQIGSTFKRSHETRQVIEDFFDSAEKGEPYLDFSSFFRRFFFPRGWYLFPFSALDQELDLKFLGGKLISKDITIEEIGPAELIRYGVSANIDICLDVAIVPVTYNLKTRDDMMKLTGESERKTSFFHMVKPTREACRFITKNKKEYLSADVVDRWLIFAGPLKENGFGDYTVKDLPLDSLSRDHYDMRNAGIDPKLKSLMLYYLLSDEPIARVMKMVDAGVDILKARFRNDNSNKTYTVTNLLINEGWVNGDPLRDYLVELVCGSENMITTHFFRIRRHGKNWSLAEMRNLGNQAYGEEFVSIDELPNLGPYSIKTERNRDAEAVVRAYFECRRDADVKTYKRVCPDQKNEDEKLLKSIFVDMYPQLKYKILGMNRTSTGDYKVLAYEDYNGHGGLRFLVAGKDNSGWFIKQTNIDLLDNN
jgi:hypothetical protein